MTSYSKILKTLSLLFFLLSSKQGMALDVGGTESMDRPSARSLPPLNTPQEEKPQEFILPKMPEASAESESYDERIFIFSKIILEGNTVLPETQLHKLLEAYESRKVKITELEELRLKITKLYIDEGYINSGAIIPIDAIDKDTLKIKAVEGRLDEINIQGLGRLREDYIKNRLQDDPDKPFNLKHLQDKFQVLLVDPLISQMSGKLLPGASVGRSVLDLSVTRAKPYSLTLFGDNYRPPSIGGEAFGLTGRVFNLTGFGDMFDFTFIKSEGSERYAGGFTVPVNPKTSVFFHFDEGESTLITKPINKLNIQSQIHNLEGGLNHSLINYYNQQLNVFLSLAVRNVETTFPGKPFSFVPGEATGQNQTSVWRISQYFMQRWQNQAFAFRSTFSVGMNGLGATPKTYDPLTGNAFPSSEFFGWLGQMQYAYRIFEDGTQLVFKGNAQFSDSPLLPLERISIGGVNTVRGYRENHLVTDNGFNFNAEYHWPVIGEANAKHRLTFIPFIDYGEAWNNTRIEQNAQKRLFSVGLGLSWQYKPVSLDLFYGYPINRPTPRTNGDLQDEAIHFQVKVDAL